MVEATRNLNDRNCAKARRYSEGIDILKHIGLISSSIDNLTIQVSGSLFHRWLVESGHLRDKEELAHDQRIYQLLSAIDSQLAAKYASAWSILTTPHPNYSGAVSEMRDTVTLVLHRLAPDDEVESLDGFSFEKDQKRPTRRQRARFVMLKKSGGFLKSLPSDIELLASQADNFASLLTNAYSTASSLTHTTAPNDLAYQSLKQGDSVLAQLLA